MTNLEAAHGRIMDADVALESTRFARQNVLVQASASMVAQANQLTQVALTDDRWMMLNFPIFLYLILNFMFTNHYTSRNSGSLPVPRYWLFSSANSVGLLFSVPNLGRPITVIAHSLNLTVMPSGIFSSGGYS